MSMLLVVYPKHVMNRIPDCRQYQNRDFSVFAGTLFCILTPLVKPFPGHTLDSLHAVFKKYPSLIACSFVCSIEVCLQFRKSGQS